MRTRRISVLLTKQNRLFSKAIYWITGRKYTHASIRLEDMGEYFFSFNFKGLCAEHPKCFSQKRTLKSILYQIEVTESIYEEIRTRLEGFWAHKEAYRYSRLGLCLCLMRIPHNSPGNYFCSQFVADLLERAQVIHLQRGASVCLPNALEKALQQSRMPYCTVLNPVFT